MSPSWHRSLAGDRPGRRRSDRARRDRRALTGTPDGHRAREQVLEIADGTALVLDGTSRLACVVDPSAERARAAARDMRARRRRAAQRAREQRDQPAVTHRRPADRRCWPTSPAPRSSRSGCAPAPRGSGCCAPSSRSSTRSTGRPSQEHAEALAPILAGLAIGPAIVRVLDFGADKSPPFLRGTHQRGLELLLAQPRRFVCAAAGDPAGRPASRGVRILLPMVDDRSSSTRRARCSTKPPLALGLERPAARLDDRDSGGC